MERLIFEIKVEIALLESWVKTSNDGGWSTHLNESMKKRAAELKCLLYDLEK